MRTDDAAIHKPTHPLNRSAAVMCALAKSPKFERVGAIEHLGHRYPVYALKLEQAAHHERDGHGRMGSPS